MMCCTEYQSRSTASLLTEVQHAGVHRAREQRDRFSGRVVLRGMLRLFRFWRRDKLRGPSLSGEGRHTVRERIYSDTG